MNNYNANWMFHPPNRSGMGRNCNRNCDRNCNKNTGRPVTCNAPEPNMVQPAHSRYSDCAGAEECDFSCGHKHGSGGQTKTPDLPGCLGECADSCVPICPGVCREPGPGDQEENPGRRGAPENGESGERLAPRGREGNPGRRGVPESGGRLVPRVSPGLRGRREQQAPRDQGEIQARGGRQVRPVTRKTVSLRHF